LHCEDSDNTYERTVEIDPNGTFYDDSMVYGVVQKGTVGTYPITASSSLSGDATDFNAVTTTLTIKK
jgi:hypothetical protein